MVKAPAHPAPDPATLDRPAPPLWLCREARRSDPACTLPTKLIVGVVVVEPAPVCEAVTKTGAAHAEEVHASTSTMTGQSKVIVESLRDACARPAPPSMP